MSDRRTVAVMFTDMVGYTVLIQEDERSRALFEAGPGHDRATLIPHPELFSHTATAVSMKGVAFNQRA